MIRWRVPLFMFVGSLLLQIAWIATVPPFRGIDEFDHAYRAAAVAHGQWVDPYVRAQHGRGDLVEVPGDLVAAAAPECEIYSYVGRDNCHPTAHLPNGMVRVASAAARYNPVFYWIIGKAAGPFTGATALYAMRAFACVLCSLFLTLAAWEISLWARTRWPLVALVVAMTPMTIYSTMLPAPNGVEMMAGLALWAGLLGLTRVQLEPGVERRLLLSCLPGIVCLATVRLLGPLWLAMIGVSFLALASRQRLAALWSRHKVVSSLAVCATLASTTAGIWWSLSEGTLNPGDDPHTRLFADPIRHSLLSVPLWILQTIAAFPTRTERAPIPVYAIGLMIFAIVLFRGMWRTPGRQRLHFATVAVASLAVPLVGVLLTYRHQGDYWQGRYQLPFALGIPLVASLALDGRRLWHRLAGPALTLCWLALVVEQTWSVVHVLIMERTSSPLAGTTEWHIPPTWLVIGLTVLGLAFWAFAVRAMPVGRAADRSELDYPGAQSNSALLAAP